MKKILENFHCVFKHFVQLTFRTELNYCPLVYPITSISRVHNQLTVFSLHRSWTNIPQLSWYEYLIGFKGKTFLCFKAEILYWTNVFSQIILLLDKTRKKILFLKCFSPGLGDMPWFAFVLYSSYVQYYEEFSE